MYTRNCVAFMVMSTKVNVSVRIGLLVSGPEILMLMMNLYLVGHYS